jgi:hypothetical protein
MARKESVRVAVIFEPGKPLRLVWFERNRQQHKVVETTYTWQDHHGDKLQRHYAVTDGEALYELVYIPVDGTWTLREQQAVA